MVGSLTGASPRRKLVVKAVMTTNLHVISIMSSETTQNYPNQPKADKLCSDVSVMSVWRHWHHWHGCICTPCGGDVSTEQYACSIQEPASFLFCAGFGVAFRLGTPVSTRPRRTLLLELQEEGHNSTFNTGTTTTHVHPTSFVIEPKKNVK